MMWYNISCLDVQDRGVLLLNAVNSTQSIIVGKAPLISGFTSRCTSRQRQQANKGRFVMALDNRKIILEAGRKFGRLTVVEDTRRRSKNGTVIWLCRCECGNLCKVLVTNLLKGSTRSCGCLRLETVRLNYGQAAFNKLYTLYRIGAEQRGLTFPLAKEEFRKLTSGNCYYCGQEPSRVSHNNGKKSKFFGNYTYNGIDRVDNLKGYEPKNCVTCCFECNQAKLALTQDGFLSLVKRIYEHLQL